MQYLAALQYKVENKKINNKIHIIKEELSTEMCIYYQVYLFPPAKNGTV